jgi:hypothetical protein
LQNQQITFLSVAHKKTDRVALFSLPGQLRAACVTNSQTPTTLLLLLLGPLPKLLAALRGKPYK